MLSHRKFKSPSLSIVAFLLAFIFLILAISAKYIPYFELDLQISQIIQNINFFGFKEFMQVLTSLGNFPQFAILTITLCYLFFLIGEKYKAYYIFLSTFGIVLIGELLKMIIGRVRPDPLLVRQELSFSSHYSFPSIHVLFYIGLLGFLSLLILLVKKKGLMHYFLITFFLLIILLIGISRIYVGAHWSSDVLGAYVLGALWLIMVYLLYKKNYKFLGARFF